MTNLDALRILVRLRQGAVSHDMNGIELGDVLCSQ